MVGTVEEIVYIGNAHLGSLLVTIIGVFGGSLMGMELKKERKVYILDAEDMRKEG